MNKFIFALILTLVSPFSYSDGVSDYARMLDLELSTKYWIDKFMVSNGGQINTEVIASHIIFNAATQSVPLDLLVGTIAVESRFNPLAKSPYGAQGIMQVVTRYHKDKIHGRNIFDPKVGLEVGTRILSTCLALHNGNRRQALNCYSGYHGKQAVKYQRAVLDQSIKFQHFVQLNKQKLQLASSLEFDSN